MSKSLLRVVLDVNILISAYFFGGVPRQVYSAALDEEYRVLHSIELRAELRRVIGYSKFADRVHRTGKSLDSLMEEFFVLGEGVVQGNIPDGTVRDKDDQMILACAIGGKADYIITGDDDLLVLMEYDGIRILTPAQFLAVLFPSRDESS